MQNDEQMIAYLTAKLERAKRFSAELTTRNRNEAAAACANYATAYEALIFEIQAGFHTPDALPDTGA